MPDVVRNLISLVVAVLGSATMILLLLAIAKWLWKRPDGWGASDDAFGSDAPDAASAEEDDVTPPREASDVAAEVKVRDAAEADAVVSGLAAAADFTGDADRPPNVREPGPGERTARLLSTGDVFYADLLSAKLRDAGIWSFVHGNADAFGATGVPMTTLVVPADDLDAARQIMADAEADAAASRARRDAPPH